MSTGLVLAMGALIALIFGVVVVPRLDLWQITLVAFIVALGMAAGSLTQLAYYAYCARFPLAVLLLVLALRSPKHGIERKRTNYLIYALWACLLIAAASTVWAFDPLETAAQAGLLGVLVCLIQALANRRWTTIDAAAADLRVAFWTAAALMIGGLVAALAGFEFALGFQDRARGFFDNANMLGYLSALTAAVGWALWLHYRRAGYLVAILGLLIAAAFSESRTAILAAAVAAAWGWLMLSTWGKLVSAWLASLVGCIVVLLMSMQLIPSPDLSDGVFARFFADADDTTFNGRTEVWALAASTARDTFTGVGFGSSPTYLVSGVDPVAIVIGLRSVHNSYLQWFMETGFAGVLPLAALLLGVVALLAGGNQSRLARGLTVVVVVGLTVQLTESMIFGTGQIYPWMFWMAVAALAVCRDTTPDEVAVETTEAKVPARV